MLRRRIPMNRGAGFGRPGVGAGAHAESIDREARLAERAARAMASAHATAGMAARSVVAGAGTTGIAINKEAAQTCEAYRRAVSALSCMWCGIAGYSQHAHLNLGKGLGLKTDDRTGFPLCCTRPGVEGCHVAYDQYRLIESGGREAHREYGKEWGRITRHTILSSGNWPARLPHWIET